MFPVSWSSRCRRWGCPADGSAAAVAASEAGMLFAARAGAASPAFELSAHNSAAVARGVRPAGWHAFGHRTGRGQVPGSGPR